MDVWYVTQFLQIQSLHTLSFNWASSSVDVTSQDVTGEGGEWLGGGGGGGGSDYVQQKEEEEAATLLCRRSASTSSDQQRAQ